MSQSLRQFWRTCCFAAAIILLPAAAQAAVLHGTVFDPTGAVIPHATVELIHGHSRVATTITNGNGRYTLHWTPTSNTQLRVTAPGFRPQQKALAANAKSSNLTIDFSLSLASLSEQITVTSTGTPTPESELGTTTTILNHHAFAGTSRLLQALPWIPGLQITQTGQTGGTTSLFLRGGGSDATKVLIDGIPANNIGGDVEFANIASSGIASIEVLRGPNSVLYGADALAGVVSLTTPRGTAPLPLVSYQADGGNFDTYHQEGTLSGTWRKTDYFSDYSRFDTRNAIPRNAYHNGTFAGNYGWAITGKSSLRATIRYDQVASQQPNAIQLFGIPDNAKQANGDAYFGVTWKDHTTPAWHNLIRYGGVRLRSQYTDFSPTGIPQYIDYSAPSGPIYNCNPRSDPACYLAGYLGAPVTLHGANGYTVSGQAVFQYAQTYPNAYPTSTDEDFAYAQSDFRFSPHLLGLAAFHYQDERGYSGGPSNSIHRGNYSYTLELQGDIDRRMFYSIGGGLQNNGLFGFAATPRIALAWQVSHGTANGLFSGTKLRASLGKGIKEPSIGDQTTSLYALLAALPSGSQLIAQYHIAPIGPEQSRSYDGGIDQLFAHGRARLSLTLFHNEFTSGLEYIYQQGLVDLGVPSVIAAKATYGATVNAEAYRAQGAEASLEYQINNALFARAGYTYTDAVIQHSFTSDAIGPAHNPAFPNIPIGIYTPLVGARPFRIAPHTGYFQFGYRHHRLAASLSGTLVSRRDDSDDLEYDASGGTSLLLPNRNLDGSYQNLSLAASYQLNHHVAITGSAHNLLSQHYSQAFGYPSLPFHFRTGIKFTLGGDRWP